ncbi:MAG: TRAP transporter substrate-binding protein DctP [Myxococcales bacterium]|nr:TRAP transporter substrate-binding protein DctP [Myxococcales bacterium]
MRVLVAVAIVGVLCGSVVADRREPVTLKLGTLAIDGSRYMKDILALGAEIERRTRGRVTLAWSSGGQLGEETEMVAKIARGKLDGGGFSETGLVALVPEMAAWGAPGMFRDAAEVDRATAALGDEVRALFAKRDLQFVMWADLGFAQLFAMEPAKTLAEAVEAAAPWLSAPLDGALALAIGSGKARAWAVPPLYQLAITGAKARFMTNLRYRYVIGGLVISAKAWARLAPNDRQIVAETCRAWEPRLRASWRTETERGIAVLAKSGVVMRTAPETQLSAFTAELGARAPASPLRDAIRAALR